MPTEDGEGEPSTPSAVAAAGPRDGRTLRDIAVDLYGRKQVDADWHADSWMRATVRRPVAWTAVSVGGR